MLSEGGRRLYSEDDLKRMKILCFLRDAGLSINSIGELLSEADPGSVISVFLEQKVLFFKGRVYLSAVPRGFQARLAVATCNYPEGHPDCNGRSTLFDGVPWQEEGVRDMCVFEAPGTPGVYIAELDLDRLRTHRSNDVMGDKYRRPDKYGIYA